MSEKYKVTIGHKNHTFIVAKDKDQILGWAIHDHGSVSDAPSLEGMWEVKSAVSVDRDKLIQAYYMAEASDILKTIADELA